MRNLMSSFALLAALPVCLWDYDTLAAEAKGMPGVVETITGRFDRYPPLYYEMRLDRCVRELESGAEDLDLYDNAAVACDRLGRGDEAIEWMARKKSILDGRSNDGANDADHTYRYLANLGTFHVHRWLRAGADRDDLTDVEIARERIAEAIVLEPDAHFGRERYQLLALDWILELSASGNPSVTLWAAADLPSGLEIWGADVLERNGYVDAVTGLAGLIVLGDAWASVDIFHALEQALLDRGDAYVSFLASARVKELLSAGRKSSSPSHPGAADYSSVAGSFIPDGRHEALSTFYREAREESESWRTRRNDYILERLRRGEHPDTHEEFWRDWKDRSAPPKPPRHRVLGSEAVAILIAAGVGLVLIAYGIFRLARRSRRRATA